MYLPLHNIVITDFASSKNVVGQMMPINFSATVGNPGNYTETFNVTVILRGGPLRTTILVPTLVTLPRRNSTTVTFTWTPTYKGNYQTGVSVDTVANETDTHDNNMTDGTVFVTFVGDVNGDGKVRVDDVYAVASRYGTNYGGPPNSNGFYYDANCDINDDLKIRVDDVYAAVQHFGQGP
jgi:hypothetical protein